MSTSEPVTCRVTAADWATQIQVLDCAQRVVAEGLGEIDTSLPPGLYTAQARAGNHVEERHLLVRNAPVIENFGVVAFASSAPLRDTRRTHEYHEGDAASTSREVRYGSGESQIFVFIRDWQSARYQPSSRPFAGPLPEVHLLDSEGKVLVDVAQQGGHNLDVPDPCWGCTIAVDPGNHRLRVRAPKLGATEQIIHTAPGWQTQVFLVRKFDDVAGCPVPDQDTASILVAPKGEGFSPESQEARIAELVRIGLINGRKVLSRAHVREMLRPGFASPMLWILAGHFLLQEEKPDLGLLRELVQHLRELLRVPHPDVEALALSLGERDYVFSMPPMLAQSLDQVIKASHATPTLVPKGSLAAQAALSRVGRGSWCTWLLRDTGSRSRSRTRGALGGMPFSSRFDSLRPFSAFDGGLESMGNASKTPPLGPMEMAILESTFPKERDVPLWAKLAPKSFEIADFGQGPELDTETTRRIAEEHQVPRGLVEDALRSLVGRIGIQPWPRTLAARDVGELRETLLRRQEMAKSCGLDDLAYAQRAAAAFWETWLAGQQVDGKEAGEDLDKLEKLSEKWRSLYRNFLQAPDEDKGEELLRAFSEAPPSSAANSLRARIYAALGRHDFAEHHLLLAVQARPQHLLYVVFLAYEQAERSVAAALSSLAAAARIKDHPRLHVHRANLELRQWVAGAREAPPIEEAKAALALAESNPAALEKNEIELAYAIVASVEKNVEEIRAELGIDKKGREVLVDTDDFS